MLDLYAELRRVVEAFDAARVSYALAGGLAVSIYTTPRATQDIDVLLPREALDGATRALEAIGFRRAGVPMQVAGGRLQIQRLIKIDGIEVLPVDLLVPIDAELTTLLADRTSMALEGSQIWVVGLPALRALKRLRGSGLGARSRRSRSSRTRMTTTVDVTLTIRRVSALRALCLRLPHIPTPAELAHLDRFGVLATNPGAATTADIESLAAGWRQWWLGDYAPAIQAMAEKLPCGLVNEDRRLASYAVAAGLRAPRERLP